MYNPSLWFRRIGALVVVLGAAALWYAPAPLLQFDRLALRAGTDALRLVAGGLLGLLAIGLALDRFRVPGRVAGVLLSPFVGVALAGILLLAEN